jgi:superfamily I DNA/RNA helicase
MIKPKESWQPTEGISLELSALEAIKSHSNELLLAGPGAGKTEFLAQFANYIFLTDNLIRKRVLAISFKKDSASNLSDRVLKRLKNLKTINFDSMTIDSFSKMIVDNYMYSTITEMRPRYDYSLIDGFEEIFKVEVKKLYGELGKNDLITLRNAFERIPYNSMGAKLKLLWERIINRSNSVLTFGMITNIALSIIESNPYIKKIYTATYCNVFLDEFQDTTTLQYELIKSIFSNSHSTVVAVGDDKQKIMVWAGADVQIFDKFKLDFKPNVRELLFNYRSCGLLVNFQFELYSNLHISSSLESPISKSDLSIGKIKLFQFNDEVQEAKAILKVIQECHSNNQKNNEIAILCKMQPEKYASTIISVFSAEGIRTRVENIYQDLIKENIVKLLLAMIEQIFINFSVESWNIVQNFFIDTSIDGFSLSKMKEYDTALKKVKNEIKISSMDDFRNLIDSLTKILDIKSIKNHYREYSQGDYFSQTIEKFINLFWIEFELHSNDFASAMSSFLGYQTIPIMSFHKSKGLEFKTVFIIGFEDGSFWTYDKQPIEDNKAFFVASSRAKQELYINSCKIRNNLAYPNQKVSKIIDLYETVKNSKLVDFEDQSS